MKQNKYLIPAWQQILIEIQKTKDVCTSSRICKMLDITYSHVSLLIHALEKDKILTLSKQGRTFEIVLTESGKAIAKNLLEIQKDMSANNEPKERKTKA